MVHEPTKGLSCTTKFLIRIQNNHAVDNARKYLISKNNVKWFKRWLLTVVLRGCLILNAAKCHFMCQSKDTKIILVFKLSCYFQ